MRLTFHTDYGLRVLMLLAAEPESLHTIDEVSARYRISKNHLMKVAMKLAQHGFVDSVRGRGGGLRLARPAAEIGIGAVVRAMEDQLSVVECFDRSSNTCLITPACALRGVLQNATAAFFAVLDDSSLADLIRTPQHARRLRQLLPYTPAPA